MATPRPRRFAHIPRHFGGCLYVAQLDSGVVKIGFSRNPATRLSSLATQCRRDFAAEIVRFHVGPDIGDREACSAEFTALNRAAQTARPHRGRREFFEGLDYDHAVALVQEASKGAT